jgi:hypothetical protein
MDKMPLVIKSANKWRSVRGYMLRLFITWSVACPVAEQRRQLDLADLRL